MKIPYGLSDFNRLRMEQRLYIDRTALIREIESAGDQLLLLRPRRFGKSLWLSTLENYYDLGMADRFNELFGGLAIAGAPTPNRGRYLILKWNFSLIDASGDYEAITRQIHSHINGQIAIFCTRYAGYIGEPVDLNESNSLRSLQNLLARLRIEGYPLYLLIDEYDNFANEVIASRNQGRRRYEELVKGEGIIKTIFKAVKSAAEGEGLERVFITGVSPLVMSDIISGYNVVKNISARPAFARLCGFTSEEVGAINHRVVDQCRQPLEMAAEAAVMMRDFYNGYRFSTDGGEPVYNPTLCLYFWDEWLDRCRYPTDLLDENLAMDRNRLAAIASFPHGGEVIEQLALPGAEVAVERLHPGFGLQEIVEDPPDASFLISLLYYFGVVTLDQVTPLGKLRVKIPNQVVRSLYIERIQRQLLNGYEDNNRRQQVAERLYTSGEFEPLADFIEQRLYTALANRDQRWSNELLLKMSLLSLLTNDLYYIPRSELPLGSGYCDLLFEIRPDKRSAPLFDLLFELKYLSLKEVGRDGAILEAMEREVVAQLPAVVRALDEATSQLQGYRQQLQLAYPATGWKLRAYAVVTIGLNRLVWREVPSVM
jgi:hypothetical protein